MSTSPRPEPIAELRRMHEDVADFLEPAFEQTRREFRTRMQMHREVQFLSHYTYDVCNFSFAAIDMEKPRRQTLQRLGRQLGLEATKLDEWLRAPRTGALIRTVLHTEHGVALCVPVVPMQNVVGVGFSEVSAGADVALSTMHDIREVDRITSAIATELRKDVSLNSVNPGGWESRSRQSARPPAQPTGDPVVRTVDDTTPDDVRTACAAAVRPDDLQFVAYCAGGRLRYSVDHLDHSSLTMFFQQITVARRRAFYQRFSTELQPVVTRLNRVLSGAALPGVLVRAVLDVEQGAVYYYRLAQDAYLVGVTIDQARVSNADDRMAELAVKITQIDR